MLLFTALATCGDVGHVTTPVLEDGPGLGGTQTGSGTHPVQTGLSAELVGLGGAEVVVGPEGLVESCDEVEKGLPATLVT